MKLQTVLVSIFLLIFVMTPLSGCDEDTKQAIIAIYSEPDPIRCGGRNQDGSTRYVFTLYIEEKAGIGAQWLEWEWDTYSINGKLLSSNSIEIEEIIYLFTECDPTIGCIAPYGTICAIITVGVGENLESGWYEIHRLRFAANNGDDFWVDGKLTFLPVS